MMPGVSCVGAMMRCAGCSGHMGIRHGSIAAQVVLHMYSRYWMFCYKGDKKGRHEPRCDTTIAHTPLCLCSSFEVSE